MIVEELDCSFGAVVRGVRLADAPPGTIAELHELWLTHALLIFPDQHLSRPDQDSFAQRFGPLEFGATPLTNMRRDGSVRADPDHTLNRSLRGNEGWHHDSTYMPVQARGAVFSAEVVPSSGGATGFADMRAAHDTLDAETRERIAPLAAKHSRRYSMDRAGLAPDEAEAHQFQLYGYDDNEPPVRPLVKVHPATGRPNLTIGQHAHAVEGMTDHESVELLDRLTAHACAGNRTHHHRWEVGDAVLWDNLRLMHRATPFDWSEPRRMWHTRIAGDPTTELAWNHQPDEPGQHAGHNRTGHEEPQLGR